MFAHRGCVRISFLMKNNYYKINFYSDATCNNSANRNMRFEINK